MATEETKGPETEPTATEEAGTETGPGMVEKLSKRGEEALTRLIEEVGKNQRVSDALGKASAAKGRADSAAKRAVGQVGGATADQLEELRKHIEKLEARLSKLEGGTRAGSESAKASETKETPSAKKGETKAESESGEGTSSPAPGRSIGGGSSRGSSAG